MCVCVCVCVCVCLCVCCSVVRCGVVWCGAVWFGVVWCDVVWCGAVWCACVVSPLQTRISPFVCLRERSRSTYSTFLTYILSTTAFLHLWRTPARVVRLRRGRKIIL